jgi:hypothetical protein
MLQRRAIGWREPAARVLMRNLCTAAQPSTCEPARPVSRAITELAESAANTRRPIACA